MSIMLVIDTLQDVSSIVLVTLRSYCNDSGPSITHTAGIVSGDVSEQQYLSAQISSFSGSGTFMLLLWTQISI